MERGGERVGERGERNAAGAPRVSRTTFHLALCPASHPVRPGRWLPNPWRAGFGKCACVTVAPLSLFSPVPPAPPAPPPPAAGVFFIPFRHRHPPTLSLTLSPPISAHGPDSLGADHERVAARHAKAAADGTGAAVDAAPACDICKAADAVLLCCDDRALMCRG